MSVCRWCDRTRKHFTLRAVGQHDIDGLEVRNPKSSFACNRCFQNNRKLQEVGKFAGGSAAGGGISTGVGGGEQPPPPQHHATGPQAPVTSAPLEVSPLPRPLLMPPLQKRTVE